MIALTVERVNKSLLYGRGPNNSCRYFTFNEGNDFLLLRAMVCKVTSFQLAQNRKWRDKVTLQRRNMSNTTSAQLSVAAKVSYW